MSDDYPNRNEVKYHQFESFGHTGSDEYNQANFDRDVNQWKLRKKLHQDTVDAVAAAKADREATAKVTKAQLEKVKADAKKMLDDAKSSCDSRLTAAKLSCSQALDAAAKKAAQQHSNNVAAQAATAVQAQDQLSEQTQQKSDMINTAQAQVAVRAKELPVSEISELAKLGADLVVSGAVKTAAVVDVELAVLDVGALEVGRPIIHLSKKPGAITLNPFGSGSPADPVLQMPQTPTTAQQVINHFAQSQQYDPYAAQYPQQYDPYAAQYPQQYDPYAAQYPQQQQQYYQPPPPQQYYQPQPQYYQPQPQYYQPQPQYYQPQPQYYQPQMSQQYDPYAQPPFYTSGDSSAKDSGVVRAFDIAAPAKNIVEAEVAASVEGTVDVAGAETDLDAEDEAFALSVGEVLANTELSVGEGPAWVDLKMDPNPAPNPVWVNQPTKTKSTQASQSTDLARQLGQLTNTVMQSAQANVPHTQAASSAQVAPPDALGQMLQQAQAVFAQAAPQVQSLLNQAIPQAQAAVSTVITPANQASAAKAATKAVLATPAGQSALEEARAEAIAPARNWGMVAAGAGVIVVAGGLIVALVSKSGTGVPTTLRSAK